MDSKVPDDVMDHKDAQAADQRIKLKERLKNNDILGLDDDDEHHMQQKVRIYIDDTPYCYEISKSTAMFCDLYRTALETDKDTHPADHVFEFSINKVLWMPDPEMPNKGILMTMKALEKAVEYLRMMERTASTPKDNLAEYRHAKKILAHRYKRPIIRKGIHAAMQDQIGSSIYMEGEKEFVESIYDDWILITQIILVSNYIGCDKLLNMASRVFAYKVCQIYPEELPPILRGILEGKVIETPKKEDHKSTCK